MLLSAAQSMQSATSGQVWAAIITAAVAGIIGLVNVGVTLHQNRVTRGATKQLVDREQWWSRFTWAAECLFSEERAQNIVAVPVLGSLANVDWIDQEDKTMIVDLFSQLNQNIASSDIEEAERGQDS